jgi:hypothetical protein
MDKKALRSYKSELRKYMKFVKKKTYYTGEVYEWNLPTGTTCPGALECKVTVDRETGKFNIS